MTTSCYIHIPFCDNLCYYCDFCKVINYKKFVYPYLDNLSKEIIDNYKGEKLKTLYVGGGTPSALNLDELSYFLDIIGKFKLDNLCEITFEMNVESTTKEKLILLKEFGVNRLSFGVQTFNDKILKDINRCHSSSDALYIVNLAKEIGFDNINVDLMFNLPNQTDNTLRGDLNFIKGLNIEHVSIYGLILEEKSVFYARGIDIDYEHYDSRYLKIKKILEDLGYILYETSNFCKDGCESKHNMIYWNCERYYGFGLGAHSYISDTRFENISSITKYLQGERVNKKEVLDKRASMQEFMFLGLRKIEGVKVDDFKSRFNENVFEIFDFLKIDRELLYYDNRIIKLTTKGLIYANEVMMHFVD